MGKVTFTPEEIKAVKIAELQKKGSLAVTKEKPSFKKKTASSGNAKKLKTFYEDYLERAGADDIAPVLYSVQDRMTVEPVDAFDLSMVTSPVTAWC